MHLKVNKKKGVRSRTEPSKEEKELEGLLSIQEWFQVYTKTVSGLWQLGPPYYHRMVYLIYCATLSAKFAKEVEKVSYHIYTQDLCTIILCVGLRAEKSL